MAARYSVIAQRLVVAAYDLRTSSALTVTELLTLAANPEDIDQVLVDDGAQRIRKLDSLTHALRGVIEDHERRRMNSPLLESGVAIGMFMYAFLDDPSLDERERKARARYRLLPEMHDALLALDPVQFEALCGRLMEALGCTGTTVTRTQGDDGVDFIAALPLRAGVPVQERRSSVFLRLVGALSFLVYGQAKRYGVDHKVGQEAILQLEGSWRSLLNQLADGTIPDHHRRALVRADFRAADPVVTVLASTSWFTRGALTKASALGVVTLDGEQVAQLTLDAGLGVLDEGPGACSLQLEGLISA